VGEVMATFCGEVKEDKASKKTVCQLVIDTFDHSGLNETKVCLTLLPDMVGRITFLCTAPFMYTPVKPV
jgi:hypothetical protein